jgi:hypothetical protein
VLLTTLTTVLGLSPLLFEQSNQAQFLKPTVVTLVYGLGFGMALVLLIVPSLLAVGHDLERMLRSVRRSLGIRGGAMGAGLKAVPLAALALVVAAFTLTMGWKLATGQVFAPLAQIMPVADAGPMGAFLAFATLSGVGLSMIWAGSGLAIWWQIRRAA